MSVYVSVVEAGPKNLRNKRREGKGRGKGSEGEIELDWKDEWREGIILTSFPLLLFLLLFFLFQSSLNQKEIDLSRDGSGAPVEI